MHRSGGQRNLSDHGTPVIPAAARARRKRDGARTGAAVTVLTTGTPVRDIRT